MAGTVQDALEELDRRHFLLLEAGRALVGIERLPSGETLSPPMFVSVDAFHHLYRGHSVEVLVEDSESGEQRPKKLSVSRLWTNWKDKRVFYGLTFDPSGKAPSYQYNQWTGFGVDPKPGDWSLMQEHIRDIVCGGDDVLNDYVLGWMAHAVQHPETPSEVALVLRGAKGTGKGTLANIFGRVFGEHYLAVSNQRHLTGHFNGHLERTVLLFVDEGFWAGHKEAEGILKQIITEPLITVEPKFQNARRAVNRLHIIMASNENWVVPARGLERRFCVLDMSDERARDMKYFRALRRQMDNGGTAAMMHNLLKRDLSGFEVRSAPMTEALREQILHSLSSFEAWWYSRLLDGKLLKQRRGWGEAKAETLYASYVAECDTRRPLTRQQFGQELRKSLPAPGLRAHRPTEKDGSRPRKYVLPDLGPCRAEWDRQRGLATDWPKEE